MKSLKIFKLLLSLVILVALATCNPTDKKSDYSSYDTGLIIPDSLITDAVETELKHIKEVPEHFIDVETIDGIVRLTGSINNILAKEKAEEIASAVRGVKGVINELTVKIEYVPDDQLRDNIERMFYYDPVINSYELDVEADSGHVIISGKVDSWSEKQLALEVAKSVRGVKSVEDKIIFNYEKKRPDHEIFTDIEGMLKFDIYIKSNSINVNVKNAKVTLSGKVGSLLEKSKAISDAWVDGVDTVVSDKLKITSANRNTMIKYKEYEHKSDAEIKNAVEQVLLYDARINPVAIDVEVEDGYVVLIGSVDNLRAKKAAKSDANNVVGVWNVENRIKVRPLKIETNKVLIENTRKALKLNPYLQYRNIAIIEENGKIYLNGEVYSYFEKQEATKAVSKVPGVVEVDNNLEVSHYPALSYPPGYFTSSAPVISNPDLKPDSKIKEDIEKELWWSPFVDKNNIKVKVEDGIAELSGKVNTPLESKIAEKNALEGGAIAVENNLVVANEP